MVNTLDMVEPRHSRTWRMSTILQIWWSLGITCTAVPTGKFIHTLVRWRHVSRWGLVKIGEFHDRTTTPECSEDKSCAEHGEGGKWALCIHTMWMIAKLSDTFDRTTLQQQLPTIFSLQLTNLVSDFGLAHNAPQPFIYPFVYSSTRTTPGLTCARNHVNRVSGVDSTSLWEAHPGVLSDTPT